MAKGVVIKEVNNWAKQAKRNLRDIADTKLKVGVTERTGARAHPNSDTKTVGDIAFFNEYGTVTAPARSFIRDWLDGNIDKIAKHIETDTLRVLMTNESMREAMTKRGRRYRKQVIDRIQRHIPPPNAPSTLAQKVGDTPLINTETLIDAIVYEVSKK